MNKGRYSFGSWGRRASMARFANYAGYAIYRVRGLPRSRCNLTDRSRPTPDSKAWLTFALGLQQTLFPTSEPMKTISIYSVGSCDAATRLGTAESLLEYNGKTKYLYQQLQDTTANRCIIEGLIAGVGQLKEPCSVLLVTATEIGVKKAARGKGVNVKLVGRLIKDLQERGCVFDFEVWAGRGDELRSKVVAGRNGPAKYFNQSASV